MKKNCEQIAATFANKDNVTSFWEVAQAYKEKKIHNYPFYDERKQKSNVSQNLLNEYNG